MINLILKIDNIHQIVETLHIDETNGGIYVYYSRTDDYKDLLSLQEMLNEDCIFSTFKVETIDNGLRLVYDNISSSNIEELTLDYDEVYECNITFLGLIRALINCEARILHVVDNKEYILDLRTLWISNNSFGAFISYLLEVNDGEFAWRTLPLFYNDIEGNLVGYDKLTFLIPHSSLLEYELHIKRVGTHIIGSDDKFQKYDKAIISSKFSLKEEKPISSTSPYALGALQMLCDVYKLSNPIIQQSVNENINKNIIQEPYIKREETGYSGYVNITSNHKIGDFTRDKYVYELKAIREMGENASLLVKNDSLFRMFKTLIEACTASYKNGVDPWLFYNQFKISKALINIVILELKVSLFYYEQPYLELLSQQSFVDTNISGYKINVKVGGREWRPIDYC